MLDKASQRSYQAPITPNRRLPLPCGRSPNSKTPSNSSTRSRPFFLFFGVGSCLTRCQDLIGSSAALCENMGHTYSSMGNYDEARFGSPRWLETAQTVETRLRSISNVLSVVWTKKRSWARRRATEQDTACFLERTSQNSRKPRHSGFNLFSFM